VASLPAVSLACRDGGGWRVALAALHGLALASLGAWLVHPALALAGLPVALLFWQRSPPTDPPLLAWDGHTWRLDGRAGQARVALDLGGWMLLHFRADRLADGVRGDGADGSRPREAWLPLSPEAGPWVPLRATLYATAVPATERPLVAP
jgi:hypothetical protein